MTAQHVVVIGGSVAGLATALFLGRRGHRVTVLEQDATPTPADPIAAGAWPRRTTPQAAHSHAFLARIGTVLAAEAPDVLAAMTDAGVRTADVNGDGEFVVINARRAVFEWVLRRAAEQQDGVEVRAGAVATGLEMHQNGGCRVTGVLTHEGPVDADVVVDAGGKRSPVRAWVARGGADDGLNRDVPCGISYLTRFYRRRGAEPTALSRGFTHGGSFDRYSCLVFPADNGAFSITFGVLPEDREMRVLRSGPAFDAAATAIPAIAPWVEPELATPISDVASMSSLHNLLRAHRPDDPLGLHAVGDARCVTNPAHTRGTTLAIVAAQRVAEVVDDHAGDPGAQAEAMHAFTDDELSVWVEDSVAQDADRLARWRPCETPEAPRWRHTLSSGQAYLAAQADPGARRAFARLQNTMTRPAAVLDDPAVVAAYEATRSSGWSPPPSPAPTHDELVAIGRASS